MSTATLTRKGQITAALATRLIESLSVEGPGYLPLVAVVELAWVLGSAYNLDRQQVADAFVALLRTKEIVVECTETVWKATRTFQTSSADFADCLIERAAVAARDE